MLRVTLSPPEDDAVQALRRDPTLSPHERAWVEMILPSAAGWSPPRMATYLRCHPETVRRRLKRFQQDGLPALRQRRTGPPRDTARRQQVATALDGLLGQDRTWTARQLAAALAEQGIPLSARQTRRYLAVMCARWRRTARTLKHKQDPVRAAQAAHTLAAFKKKAQAGTLRLVFLDECGFAPSQPLNYSWVRLGERTRIPSENPQGRRLHVLAALVPDGPHAALAWVPFPGTFRADHIVRLCEELPPVPVPTVVVLDNASIHTSTEVKAARPALRHPSHLPLLPAALLTGPE